MEDQRQAGDRITGGDPGIYFAVSIAKEPFHNADGDAYYKAESLQKGAADMDYKLPYYMTYPMPFEYDDDRKERQDMEYMKSMYPDEVKRILPYVENECDRMEYEGSMIYDEYPDMLSVRMMGTRICNQMKRMETQQRDQEDDREENIRNIVEVLLLHELMKRRTERRRRRRQYYPGWS